MATYQIPTPEQMNCSGDLPTNWKMFREAYEDYLVATGLDKKDKKIQVATLKTLMGTECKKILKRLQLTEAEMEDPQTILDALQDHFVPLGIYCMSDTFSTTRSSKHMKLLISI